jgi:hypothetical protein
MSLKNVILLCGLLFGFALFSQANNLNGTIVTTDGNYVSYASVVVKNTTNGAITNLKGEFTIYLKKGQYSLVISAMGYKTTEVQVNIVKDIENKRFIIADDVAQIDAVIINSDRRDLAKQIIKKTQIRRQQNQQSLNSFTVNFYCKNTLENGNPNFIDSFPDSSDRENVHFIETYSQLFFKQKDRYKEVKLGFRDYQLQEHIAQPGQSISMSLTSDQFERGDAYDKQTLTSNPLHMVNNRSESDFNLYQNQLNLPSLDETPFTSPIGKSSLLVYNYDLIGSFFEGTKKIYELNVWPKFKSSNLLTGTLYIEDISFALVGSKLDFPSQSLHYLKHFSLVQHYVEKDSIYVLDNEEYIYHAKLKKDEYSYGNTFTQYSDYSINKEITNSFMNKGLSVYSEGADSLDDDIWASVRPHSLKPKELDFIYKQDSIYNYRNSMEYLKEQDSIVNLIKWYNVLLTGITRINRPKGMTYYFGPLIIAPRPFAVGGYRHALTGSVKKTWKNKKHLEASYDVNYGFRNKDIKGDVKFNYLFDPMKYSSVFIKGGDNYARLNSDESIEATFSRSNYLRRFNFGFGGQHEILNGLLLSASTDFSAFTSIKGLELAPWSTDLFGDLNVPQDFGGYNQLLLDVGLIYQPRMKYVKTKYQKVAKGSAFPKFTMNYRKGIKPFLSSDVNYDLLTFGMSQELKIGSVGTSKYRIFAGRFLNDREIRIADQKFFRRSDKYFFSNPLYTMQQLGPSIRTTKSYFQGHYIHQFNGALMNKVPLINRLKLQSLGGASILLIEENGFAQTELFAGLSKSFSIRGQLFKLTSVYVSSVNSETPIAAGFKIGLDFYNDWSKKWSY